MALIDFFDLELHDALDFALDILPVVGTIYRVAKICYRCAQRDFGTIGNCQVNYFECGNCDARISQYTNACSFTVNSYTGQIGHAAHVPAGQKWYWTGSKLWVPYYVKARGLKGRSLVLETIISEYSSARILRSFSSLLDANYDSSIWDGLEHGFPESNLETAEKILAVDGKLKSEYGDIVFEDRRLIKPWE